MQDEEIRNIQAQLQRERAQLADEIGSRFSSLTAKTKTKPTAPAAPFVPRPATLGLGAEMPKTEMRDADRRLKGVIGGKRKWEGDVQPKRANGLHTNDADEGEGKGAATSRKRNPSSQDPFKKSRKAKAKAAKATARTSAEDATSTEAPPPSITDAGPSVEKATTASGIASASRTSLKQSAPVQPAANEKASGAQDPLQAARSKLAGARFRQINEQLYTSPSSEAIALMQAEPDKMLEYHEGFREQTKGWPKVPVRQLFDMLQAAQRQADEMQATVNSKGKGKANGQPAADGQAIAVEKGLKYGHGRYAKGALIVDLGAGEGMLAKWLAKDGSIRPRVLSFDLLNSDDGWVVGIDVARENGLPLPGKALSLIDAAQKSASAEDDTTRIVDVAVFCLSLMATNWIDKIREASRILRPYGELLVAEVTSRFTDTAAFKRIVTALGFRLQSEDASNTHFVLFTFVKLPSNQWTAPFATQAGLRTFVDQGASILKPCIYKRR